MHPLALETRRGKKHGGHEHDDDIRTPVANEVTGVKTHRLADETQKTHLLLLARDRQNRCYIPRRVYLSQGGSTNSEAGLTIQKRAYTIRGGSFDAARTCVRGNTNPHPIADTTTMMTADDSRAPLMTGSKQGDDR